MLPGLRFEMHTRGALSGRCDVLDNLINPYTAKEINPNYYSFRSFCTIKTVDARYVERLNCGLWVTSGIWKDDGMTIEYVPSKPFTYSKSMRYNLLIICSAFRVM